MNTYRKTTDCPEIWGDYGYGWECVTGAESFTDAKRLLREYRENEPQYRHKIKWVREENPDYISRSERLMPGGVPRYIRCYDNGGETADRYTVVYTGRYKKVRGWFDYVSMNGQPFFGIGQHLQSEFLPVDRPAHSHLGKRIKFADLPEDCQHVVLTDYLTHWDIVKKDE